MEDARIVELFWVRSEKAIEETSAKYGKYCYAIAHSILANSEDAEESVNDTYHTFIHYGFCCFWRADRNSGYV